MKILFVCKYNRFRSRVAEAYFNLVNKDKKVKCSSAGLIEGNPLSKFEVRVARSAGLNINGDPTSLSSKLIMDQDLIVIVAKDVPRSVFNNKDYKAKVVEWKIGDVYVQDERKIMKVIDKIKVKVDKLVRKIGVKK
jgi:protein-tyrosine-phosphatase